MTEKEEAQADAAARAMIDGGQDEGLDAQDGTDHLCLALYGRKAKPSDYLGGSDASMLKVAAYEIRRLRIHEAALRGLLDGLDMLQANARDDIEKEAKASDGF